MYVAISISTVDCAHNQRLNFELACPQRARYPTRHTPLSPVTHLVATGTEQYALSLSLSSSSSPQSLLPAFLWLKGGCVPPPKIVHACKLTLLSLSACNILHVDSNIKFFLWECVCGWVVTVAQSFLLRSADLYRNDCMY